MNILDMNLDAVRDFFQRKSLAGFNFFLNNRISNDYWRKFSGKSKTFKKNKRRGL